MKFADKLERLRKTRGLSQENIAEKCHVSRQAVSKWESGNSLPDIDNLIIIGRLFGVSLDYLVNDKIEEVIPLAAVSYSDNAEDGLLSTVVGKWCIIQFNFAEYSLFGDGWKMKILGYDDKFFYGKRIHHRKAKWCIIKRKAIKSYDLIQISANKESAYNIEESDLDFNFILEKLYGKKCIFGKECDWLTRIFIGGDEIKGIIQSYDCGILNIKAGNKTRVADITEMVYLSEL
ncbi:helix-turn-helix domain-containing protein [Anaerocolumna xylanovorans]|uniref:Helix-turn-helix n=1 Tax=Anaerocolumna xylanovorans DSM 12503 TaxID=1121345 RepID=A0A1M7Y989_9FIRM|nr:helix-turn-helix transcriptional regulator [Anaerocolumna xylanovorans]SHO49205.1 Helix-turn-helix [Anaerocolumna xylanovorans DSM 12503]